MAGKLDSVAAQLLEAAASALQGDGATTQALIARATVLLQDKLGRPEPAPQSVTRTVERDVPGGLSTWRAKRVAAYVESNLSRTIRIEDLAQLVNLSNSYFCHAFKRRYGMTVHVYITYRRVEVAQGLMLGTDDSLSEIALSCGMSDQAHFTRAFRRVVGETPNRWRQSQLATRGRDLPDTAAEAVGFVPSSPFSTQREPAG